SNGNWTSPNGAFNTQWASSFGIFAGTAGTVTVGGLVTFNGLQFSTTGYQVVSGAGGFLSPAGQAVLRADPGVTATIAATLTGAGGIVKTHAGPIVLARATN